MSLIIFIISVASLVLIDQYSKILATTHLLNQPRISVIEGIFELTYVENRGAAFGMLQGKQGFFIVITVIILSIILYYYFKLLKDKKYKWLKFCFILITAGAIGNFIDRVSKGFVVDYFYFKPIDFPVFNVADCYVVVGTILFSILIFTVYRKDFLDQ